MLPDQSARRHRKPRVAAVDTRVNDGAPARLPGFGFALSLGLRRRTSTPFSAETGRYFRAGYFESPPFSADTIASPIALVETTSQPSLLMSGVRRPFASTLAIAASTRSAASPRPKE